MGQFESSGATLCVAMARPRDQPHVVTRADVARGGTEIRAALQVEIQACPHCNALLGSDHRKWCQLYDDPDAPFPASEAGGSARTSGSDGDR